MAFNPFDSVKVDIVGSNAIQTQALDNRHVQRIAGQQGKCLDVLQHPVEIGGLYSHKIDVRQQCQFAQGTIDPIAMGSNCFGLVFSQYFEGITVRRFLYPC
jgi:hypothetical protein